jgi:hypothetical protein
MIGPRKGFWNMSLTVLTSVLIVRSEYVTRTKKTIPGYHPGWWKGSSYLSAIQSIWNRKSKNNSSLVIELIMWKIFPSGVW